MGVERVEATLEALGIFPKTEPAGLSDSRVVSNTRRLRGVSLKDLTCEDLRFLAIQRFGLEYIIPLMLALLEEDPLASGDLYRGDLLVAVLHAPREFWTAHPDLNNRLVEILTEVQLLTETLTEDVLPRVKEFRYL